MDLASIEDLIQYQFQAAHLAEEALTAAGAGQSSKSEHAKEPRRYGNKRLALLGDALIRLAVVDDWYPSGSSPARGQGDFARIGTNDALSQRGRQQGLADLVIKHPCQQHRVPKTTLASSMEAVIGAVWIDSGKNLEQVRTTMEKLGIGCCSR